MKKGKNVGYIYRGGNGKREGGNKNKVSKKREEVSTTAEEQC